MDIWGIYNNINNKELKVKHPCSTRVYSKRWIIERNYPKSGFLSVVANSQGLEISQISKAHTSNTVQHG